MSFTVLTIALAPGLAVMLVAAATHSKPKTHAAAAIATAVAVVIGANRYALLDLAGVALGYWIAVRMLNKLAAKRATSAAAGNELQSTAATHNNRLTAESAAMLHSQRLERATQQAARAKRIGIMIICALIAMGVASCFFSGRTSVAPMPAPTPEQPPSPIAPPSVTAVPPTQSKAAAAPRQARKESPPGPRRTVQECLAISAERAMRECLRNTE